MAIKIWFPLRKCNKLFIIWIIIAFLGWCFVLLRENSSVQIISDEVGIIAKKNQFYFDKVSVFTRRLSEASLKWVELKYTAKELLSYTTSDRKLLLWGVGEQKDEEQSLLKIIRSKYNVDLASDSIEQIERLGAPLHDIPRPMLVHFSNDLTKRSVLKSISQHPDQVIAADDRMIARMTQDDSTIDRTCTMRLQKIKDPEKHALISNISVGAYLQDVSYIDAQNNTDKGQSINRRDQRVWIAQKDAANRILLEYDSIESLAKNHPPSTNYTLPYAWSGTGHVIISSCLYYVRAKTNFIVKYGLHQRKMIRSRQIPGSLFAGQEDEQDGCPYESGLHSDITLQADEFGLWATYCSSKGDSTNMKLALIDEESLKVRKQWDTKWRKNWFEAIFVSCGIAYAIRRFNSEPYLQIKYAYNTMTSEAVKLPHTFSSALSVDPDQNGKITQLSYDRTLKILRVWTDRGQLLSLIVKFDFEGRLFYENFSDIK